MRLSKSSVNPKFFKFCVEHLMIRTYMKRIKKRPKYANDRGNVFYTTIRI